MPGNAVSGRHVLQHMKEDRCMYVLTGHASMAQRVLLRVPPERFAGWQGS